MKNINRSAIYQVSKSALVISLLTGSLIISGCGSSGGSSALTATGTTTVNKGVITGFGSVYVNGIKFETNNSSFEIDNKTETSQANLRVGMVVTINGTVNSDGKTGKATFIQYDNELKGPISSVTDVDATTKILRIFNRDVTVTTDTVFDNDGGLTFATLLNTITLADNIVVEVSGLVTGDAITATHIEQQDGANNADGKVEILGPVASISGKTLDDFTFKVHGFDVKTTGSTTLEKLVVSDLSKTPFVEVKGTLSGNILTATKIKAKKKGLGEVNADEGEVEGVITAYDSVANTLEIQGQTVDVSNAILFPSSLVLADGLTVEADGAIVNGILVAKKVKQKGNKIKIKASISNIDTVNGTITFTFNSTNIVVRVNQQTEIKGSHDQLLALTDLQVGDFVKMKAFDDGTTTTNAIELEVKSGSNSEIKAAIQSSDAVNSTVTILGVVFDLSNATFNSAPIASFYSSSALTDGQFLELRDNGNDGVINSVRFDD